MNGEAVSHRASRSCMCGRPHTGGPLPVRDDRPTIVDRVQSLLVTGESRAPRPPSRAYWSIPNRDLDPKGGPFDTTTPCRFERERVGSIDRDRRARNAGPDRARSHAPPHDRTGGYRLVLLLLAVRARASGLARALRPNGREFKEALFAIVSKKASKGFLLLFSSFVCIVSLVT